MTERPVPAHSAMDTAHQFVETLLARGVREAVLSPGSRSGPLALALGAADAQGLVRLHVRLDEREAGFLALGLAKASSLPVPVVTTSGTAAANLHPALLEAWHSAVPVIAVTADRPAVLRGTGANQTTNQINLLPPIETFGSVTDLPDSLTTPVHVNVELDQPLIDPAQWKFRAPDADASLSQIGEPHAIERVPLGPLTVVIAGDGAPGEYAAISEAAGWPIIAEPSSNLRHAPTALATGRLLLGVPHLAARIERVISLGHATLSRPVTGLLARADIPIMHVGDQRTFPVPAGANVTFHLALAGHEGLGDWAAEWIAADKALSELLPKVDALTVARAVGSSIRSEAIVTLGPSQVLRDLDLMLPARTGKPRLLSNRGLAGIDGVISTAIGATLAHGGQGFAFMGDLTFLHGSSGLMLGASEPRPDLTIVVLNDDGGSIFSSLEQGAPEYQEHFERVYATPIGARVAQLCEGMNVAHRDVAVSELDAALKQPTPGLQVLEVRVSRADRRALSQEISLVSQRLF